MAVAPDGLLVAERPGGCGSLAVTGLTLKPGSEGLQLYVALQNIGSSPACGASFSAELFDVAEQPLAAGVGGLLVKRFFRLADGSGTAACLAPGDVSLGALRDWGAELAAEEVRRVEYWCNYWALEVEPIGSVNVDDVASAPRRGGTAFTGVLHNGLDAPLPSPAVVVFPLDAQGRPLDVASAESPHELQSGGSWSFETGAVTDAGVSFAAFPTRGP